MEPERAGPLGAELDGIRPTGEAGLVVADSTKPGPMEDGTE